MGAYCHAGAILRGVHLTDARAPDAGQIHPANGEYYERIDYTEGRGQSEDP